MQDVDYPYIATHDGRFHADDVFALAAMRSLPEFGDMPVWRTRDRAVIDKAEAAVDVGFVHDPSTHRYDHHQRGKPLSPEGYPYSAFGLVWASHGPRMVANLTNAPLAEPSEVLLPEHVEAAEKLRLTFVREIDLADNGIGRQNPSDINDAIGALNPEPGGPGDLSSFDDAVSFAHRILRGMCRNAVRAARHAAKVDAVLGTAKDGVLILDEQLEWRDRILAHNADNPGSEIDFVICPRGDDFTLMSVPTEQDSFASRRLLPEALRGLTEEEMAAAKGNLDVVFVHGNGFFAAGKLEALVELAKESVDGGPPLPTP